MNFTFNNLLQLQGLREQLLQVYKEKHPLTGHGLKKSKHNAVILSLQKELYETSGDKLRVSAGTLVDFFFDDTRLSRRADFIAAIEKYIRHGLGDAANDFKSGIACANEHKFTEALGWFEKAYNKEPDNADYAIKYADSLCDYSKTDEARRILTKTLEVELRIYGEAAPIVARIYFSMGILNDNEDNLAQAVKYFEKAREIALLQPQPPTDLLWIYNRLSVCYLRLGAIEKAAELNRLVIAPLEKDGKINAKLGFAYRIRGHISLLKGTYTNDCGDFRKSIEVFEKLGTPSRYEVGSYDAMGEYLLAVGDFLGALHSFTRALQSTEKYWGSKMPWHVAHYYRIGAANTKLKNYTEARSYYLMALEMYKSIRQNTQVLCALIYNGLATTEWHIGNTEMAKEYWEKAIEVQLLCYPANKDLLAYIYANLGNYYAKQNNFEKAERLCANGLDIMIETQGGEHIKTGEYYNKFVTLYRQKDDKKAGRIYAEKALPIMRHYKNTNRLAADIAQQFEENMEWLDMSY